MITYFIEKESTKEIIHYRGSLPTFVKLNLEVRDTEKVDTIRRMLYNTMKSQQFYRGFRINGSINGEVEREVETKKESFKELKQELSEKKPVRNVLVIGDLHFPFEHRNALQFAKDVYNREDITDVVYIGDVIDNHFGSYHETSTEGYGAGTELDLAINKVQDWYKAFGKATVLIGNHDKIPYRKAQTGGIHKKWMRPFDEVLNVPEWEFKVNHTIGNFYFYHGDRQNVIAKARSLSMSTVGGHHHSKFSCTLVATNKHTDNFAIQTGCLVDHKSYAMAYASEGMPIVKGLVVIKDIEGDVEIKMIPMPKKFKGGK